MLEARTTPGERRVWGEMGGGNQGVRHGRLAPWRPAPPAASVSASLSLALQFSFSAWLFSVIVSLSLLFKISFFLDLIASLFFCVFFFLPLFFSLLAYFSSLLFL